MTPPFDLDSLRAQYPDIPGWGVRLFIELHDIKAAITSAGSWTPKDVAMIAGAFAGSIVALQQTGLI